MNDDGETRLKITAEKDQQSQYVIRIEIEPNELEAAKGKAAKRLSNNVRIPGFRPGKAPRAIVERFVGQAALVEEATRDLMPKAYEEALRDQQIKPIGEPDVKLESSDPLTIIATVPVEPTVTIGDYKSIKLEPTSVEVTEDEVNKVLEQLVEQNSTWEEPEQERAAQEGDQVEIEMQTIRDGELVGEPFTRTGVLGKQELLEQIEQQVIGMQTNEEKDIEVVRSTPKAELAAPSETTEATADTDEQATPAASIEPGPPTEQALVQPGDNIEEGLGEVSSELAVGADVPAVETIPLEPEEAEQQAQAPLHYHVKLNSVKEKHSPALDDDFVASVSDLQTMEELTERVRLNLLKQKQSESNREITERFVREAVEQSHIEMPPVLVNQQIHQLEDDLAQRLKQQKLTIDQYLSITGKSHEDFHEDLRPQAEEQLKNQLVLLEIARAEGIAPEDVSEADINEEIDGFIEQYTQDAPAETLDQQKQRLRTLYNSKEARDNIRGDVFSRKLGERLIELSTGLKPDSEAMQAAEATDAELDLELKSDPNLASEASEVKEELTQGEIAE